MFDKGLHSRKANQSSVQRIVAFHLYGLSRMNGSATPKVLGMKRSAVEKTGGKSNEESDFSNKSRNDSNLQR